MTDDLKLRDQAGRAVYEAMAAITSGSRVLPWHTFDEVMRVPYERAGMAAITPHLAELSDLRRRVAQAEALALTLQQQRDQAEASVIALREALALDQARLQSAWAVAEAARAFLRADPAVENLADLLIALRAAVEDWER